MEQLTITHQNIKHMEVNLQIDYKDYQISYYKNNKTFTLTVYNDDGSASYIINDKNYNDCILDMLNICLKPYIDMIIDKKVFKK